MVKVEKDDDAIQVGDIVRVVNKGKTYPTFGSWTGLKGYEQNYKYEFIPTNGQIGKVINIAKHDLMSPMLALVRMENSERVFIINIKGIEKVR